MFSALPPSSFFSIFRCHVSSFILSTQSTCPHACSLLHLASFCEVFFPASAAYYNSQEFNISLLQLDCSCFCFFSLLLHSYHQDHLLDSRWELRRQKNRNYSAWVSPYQACITGQEKGFTVGSWKPFLFHRQSFSMFSKSLALHSILSCFLLIFSLSISYFILSSYKDRVWCQLILSCHYGSWRADTTGQFFLFWSRILGYWVVGLLLVCDVISEGSFLRAHRLSLGQLKKRAGHVSLVPLGLYLGLIVRSARLEFKP